MTEPTPEPSNDAELDLAIARLRARQERQRSRRRRNIFRRIATFVNAHIATVLLVIALIALTGLGWAIEAGAEAARVQKANSQELIQLQDLVKENAKLEKAVNLTNANKIKSDQALLCGGFTALAKFPDSAATTAPGKSLLKWARQGVVTLHC